MPIQNFFVAEVRDKDELCRKKRGINIVFHAATYNHVILCERAPEQAVQTNIHDVQNIIAAAFENRVETIIFTSPEKVLNPINVMGTSKLMGERLMTAANTNKRGEGLRFLLPLDSVMSWGQADRSLLFFIIGLQRVGLLHLPIRI